MCGVALALLATSPAQLANAQPAPSKSSLAVSDEDASVAEVVVTGTLIRGVAPTGTNVVGLGHDEIAATGATNVQDLLAEIPQINNNFGGTPAPGQETGSPGNRPNIRNLGGTVGSATTLVLLNGHRLVGAGAIVTTPDPGVVPTIVLERVEVVPDGGSSIYGSDAIGGVINLIARRRMDGVRVQARAGFGDHGYTTQTVGAIAGRDWGSGSAYIAYEYFHHDDILGKDVGYVSDDLRSQGGTDFRSANCAPGNVTVAGVPYALPGRAPNTRNFCDTSRNTDFYPEEMHHSFYGSIVQELTDSLSFDGHFVYTRRRDDRLGAPLSASSTINRANPFFTPVGTETSQTVAFDFSPIFGPTTRSFIDLREYGLTAAVTRRFADSWQLRLQGNYGSSRVLQHSPAINPAALSAALAGTNLATALNPYNLSASAGGVLQGIVNYEGFFDSPQQEIAELRAVADGTLFAIAGGDVRLALGTEYHAESIFGRSGNVVPGTTDGLVYARGHRSVWSAFGEVLVPIFGESNVAPMLQSLQLSLSGRYDAYSDVGGTFNPKVGLTYRPVDWIKLRGNYGTSFNAPSLADTVAGVDSRINPLANSARFGVRPGDAASNVQRRTIILAGSSPDLKPQTADTYSIGVDLEPPFLTGLRASVTYYNVHFRDAIAFVPLNSTIYTPPYASFIVMNPTLEQLRTLVAGYRLTGVNSLEELYQGTSPYIFADARRKNLGAIQQDGVDFDLRYTHETGFGNLTASLAGTYTLNRRSIPVRGAPEANDLDLGNNRFRYIAALGAHSGPIAGRISLNYSQGYPVANIAGQTRIDSFKTVDLFASYDIPGSGLMQDLKLSLNVENLFNEDPPFLNTPGGFGNGRTLGRVVLLGVDKRF